MVRNDPSQVLKASRTWTATVTPSFTDNPLISGTTVIKAIHIDELRTRINTLRADKCGLTAFSFTNATLRTAVTTIRAVHVLELRTALNQAYTACGKTAPTYTDSSLTHSRVHN